MSEDSETKTLAETLGGPPGLARAAEAIGRGAPIDAEKELDALEPFAELSVGPRALAFTLRGVVLHQRGLPDDALSVWREVAMLEADVPGQAAAAHFNIAVLEASRGRIDDAMKHWAEVTRFREAAPPLAAAAHLNLGAIHAQRGERDAAIETWTKATELAAVVPDQAAKAHMNLADYLRDMGQAERAVEHYLKTAGLDRAAPELAAKAHARLGLFALNAQRRDVARAHWMAAIGLVPSTPVHFELGILSLAEGDRTQAKLHWHTAISYAQQDPVAAAKAHLNLGQLAREAIAFDEARKHWKEAGELSWGILRKSLNERTPELVEVLRKSSVNEALVLAELGAEEEARERVSDALDDLEDVLGYFQKALGARSAEAEALADALGQKDERVRRGLARGLASLIAELARVKVDTAQITGKTIEELKPELDAQIELANRVAALDPAAPKQPAS